MRNLVLLIMFVLGVTAMKAQAFNGKGDSKLNIGATFQANGSGIVAVYDEGLGENFSVGISTGYVLDVNDQINASFTDRINFVARLNANIGNVFKLDDAVDVYPGINLSLKQFGGHLGGRYFFSDGFGVFTEFLVPFAKYKSGRLSRAQLLNNQFVFRLGAVFNL